MTLIPCPACSNPLSTGAAACPKCGHVIKAANAPGGINLKDPVHLIGVLVGVPLIFLIVFWLMQR